MAQESEEDGFDEVPVFGATGKERRELKDVALEPVDIDDGEIAATRSCDIEAETVLIARTEGKKAVERLDDEVAYAGFAMVLAFGTVFGEEIEDFVLFEVNAFDFVIEHALFDGRPWD